MEKFDIAIVGAGPAGVAAALQARSLLPPSRARVCLLDRSVFPRPKLCGGGLTARTQELLACLELELEVPFVDVDCLRFVTPSETVDRRGPSLFRVVRREEFDLSLVLAAKRRGVEVLEGDAVARLNRFGGGIELRLASGRSIGASIVIGADGANSLVRRSLVPTFTRAQPFVALEVLTPGVAVPGLATFDFRTIVEGVRGYAWDFPSLMDGKPVMNRGIAAIGEVPDQALRDVFRSMLLARGVRLNEHRLEGAWAPLYHPDRVQSSRRVVLAGDAVGIDPWLGEGISSAIGTGILAGHTAVEALASGDVGFEDYALRLRRSTVGEALERNLEIAGRFYGPTAERPAPWTHAAAAV